MAKKTIQQLKAEISRLKNRLNGCTNCVVGRRLRIEIEGMIQRREEEFNASIEQCADCTSSFYTNCKEL